MGRRRGRMLLASGAVGLALTACIACTPTPAPRPTPTGFASAEEAFAAAEATYRAYVDALNSQRAMEESLPDPSTFLTGDALAAEVAATEALAARSMRLDGPTRVQSVRHIQADALSADVGICLDASLTRVIDDDGRDRTPSDRADALGLRVQVIWSASQPLISSTEASDSEC